PYKRDSSGVAPASPQVAYRALLERCIGRPPKKVGCIFGPRRGLRLLTSDCSRKSEIVPNFGKTSARAVRPGEGGPEPALRKPIGRIFPACCARAANGHAAAPPSSVAKNFRRSM